MYLAKVYVNFRLQLNIYQIQILESTIKDYQKPLDSPITLNELQDKIQILQPKKACGVDVS
jgi:hypothetical protein